VKSSNIDHSIPSKSGFLLVKMKYANQTHYKGNNSSMKSS